MTIANETTALDFVQDFLTIYETKGIEDRFDKTTNKMATSDEVYSLVKRARGMLPEKMKSGAEADVANKAVTPAVVDEVIANSPRIHDARTLFSKRMAVNGGLQGLVQELLEAEASGDIDRVNEVTEKIRLIGRADRGENVFDS